MCFFFNDTATTEIYTLSLHDALPISSLWVNRPQNSPRARPKKGSGNWLFCALEMLTSLVVRSEEHTSELQSRQYLVCRLLLEKKQLPQDRYRGLWRGDGCHRSLRCRP